MEIRIIIKHWCRDSILETDFFKSYCQFMCGFASLFWRHIRNYKVIINIPGVARAVLQKTLVIPSFNQSSFSSKSSKNHKSQTVRARDL